MIYFKFRKFNKMIKSQNIFNDYQDLFQGEICHGEKSMGLRCDAKYASMQSILDSLNALENNQIFQKIDTKGAGYKISHEILLNASPIEGMVVDFHQVDLHQNRVENFIKNFSLKLMYVHSNNCILIGKNGTPLAVECAFSSLPVGADRSLDLPDLLHQPCSPDLGEHSILFR